MINITSCKHGSFILVLQAIIKLEKEEKSHSLVYFNPVGLMCTFKSSTSLLLHLPRNHCQEIGAGL